MIAAFDDFDHPLHPGEFEPGIDALAVEIHRQRHQADVTGALAVAEQAAFDAVGACHHRPAPRWQRRYPRSLCGWTLMHTSARREK